MDKYDYLVVGAGLYGSTFAYFATLEGKKCLVIDKRPQVGGNLYCESIEGINVHKYGAHIFHTSNRKIWEFVNSLTEFNHYINSPLANYKGVFYNMPFNMNTFNKMWGVITPEEAYQKIEEQKRDVVEQMKAAGVFYPRNLEEQALLLVGKDIYEKLVKGYTEKQWGRKCADLPAFIIRRLPVRFVYDNNYFNDTYQGIPIGGYNKLIGRMLEGVETKVNTNFFEDKAYWESVADNIVFTGSIDEYYDYCFGHLEYRAIRFEEEICDIPNYQGNAVINYTDASVPYTRVIEHKHFELFGANVYDIKTTVISKEYSAEWHSGIEPYYPINDDKNIYLYNKYKERAEKEKNVLFGGRLAEYKYYDMAPIVGAVMEKFHKL